MRDLYHNLLVTQPVNPSVATTTQTSGAIDLQGYGSASVVFSLGQSGDTLSGSLYWTLKLQHSDDDSSYTNVAAADVIDGITSIVVDDAAEDERSYSMGYIGNKQYIKAVATPTGSHSNGTPLGVLALRGTASLSPVA